jgi:inhibitor of cysteine peptidase
MTNTKYALVALLGIAVIFIGIVLISSLVRAPRVDVERSLAYIRTVDIEILESFPLQAVAVVRGDLQDSCSVIDLIEVNKIESLFDISLHTAKPQGVMCAQVVSPFTERVSLDIDGLLAGTYTVSANGITNTFELLADNIFTPEEIAESERLMDEGK